MNDEQLTCPVCDRPNIEGDICPNCETNLSLVRMLIELPTQEKQTATSKSGFWHSYSEKIGSFNWLAVGLALLLILISTFFFISTNATFTPKAFSF